MGMNDIEFFDINASDLVNLNSIFKTINTIQKSIDSKSIVITFNQENIFINPLFFILLFNIFYSRKDQSTRLAIDLTKLQNDDSSDIMSTKCQYYALRFLTQYIDTKTLSWYKKILPKENTYYENHDGEFLAKRGIKKIYLYSSEPYKTASFIDADSTNKHTYSMIPILQLTNIAYDDFENIDSERKKDYQKFDIENLTVSELRLRLKDGINELLVSLGFSKNDSSNYITNQLSNIFFEMIDNIKKHTQNEMNNYANSHISFYKNTSKTEKNTYEMIIADSYSKGFLWKYKEVLGKEQDTLISNISKAGKKLEDDVFKEYEDEINLLNIQDEEAMKIFLEKLFDINTVFSMHQIPRISMHFGIPTLIKLVTKLKGKLEVFLHAEDYTIPSSKLEKLTFNELSKPLSIQNFQYHFDEFIKNSNKDYFYKVTIENGIPHAEKIENGVKGTYFYITFPENMYTLPQDFDVNELEAVSLSLKSSDHKKFFKYKEEIQNEINNFKYTSLINLKNNKLPTDNTGAITVIYDDSWDESISDFLRYLYRYTFSHNIHDVLVSNFPIKKFENYLDILIHILYPDESRIYENDTLNIAFYDDLSTSIAFIGGKNKNKFCAINKEISKIYNHDQKDFFHTICDGSNNEKFETTSQLFYKLNEDYILLPFEIFELTDNENNAYNILDKIIQNKLEDSKLPIHVDTKQGYHINNFYQFKIFFEDSQWVHRISFLLASKIIWNSNVTFIGTDNYTGLVISFTKSLLESEKNKKIHSYIIEDFQENNFHKVNQYITNEEKEKQQIVIFSPVTLGGQKIIKNILPFITSSYKWFSAIKIILDNPKYKCDSNYFSQLKLIEDKDYIDLRKSKTCKKCTGIDEDPLYELSDCNPYNLKDYYRNKYEPKKLNGYIPIKNVKWLNEIHFTHAIRGMNHYTYYTKTKLFFETNLEQIKDDFLIPLKEKIDNKKQNIIFAPRHNTNNDFISLVNQIVFDNNAVIYRFDKSRGESNYYDIENLTTELEYINKTSIYFIDDEISSGNTLEYFYSLLKIKFPLRTFDGVIVLIDRTSINDEKIIYNFLNENNNVFAFTNLEIKPIKTANEVCFLCKRREDYFALLENSVLDMNRFQIANRIVKLQPTDYTEIDNIKNNNFNENFKNKIKMYAVDFVYRNYSKFEKLSFIEDRHKLEEAYTKSIEKKFKKEIFYTMIINYFNEFLNDFSKKHRKEILISLKSICYYEANIALIKALSFPKLVYFEKIRYVATKIIIKRIEDKTILKSSDNSAPKIIDEVIHIIKFHDALELFTNNDIKHKLLNTFIEKYSKKINFDYVNFLYIVAGYLNINYLLHKNNIKYYYNMINYIKEHSDSYEASMFHAYPSAVKMIYTYSKDRAIYFESQVKTFFQEQRNAGEIINHYKEAYSLVHALILESNYTINKKLNDIPFQDKLTKLSLNKEINLDDKINSLSRYLKNILENNKIKKDSFKIESIFINENLNIKYDNYQKYLQQSKLRDLLNNFQELDNNKNIVNLYNGFITKSYTIIKKKKINNTWANRCIDEKYTIIRLIDIDFSKLLNIKNKSITFLRQNTNVNESINASEHQYILKNNHSFGNTITELISMNPIEFNIPIWLKPIGCIVISHSEENDYTYHIALARIILSVQNDIVSFIKNEFNLETFQEKIRIKKIEEDNLIIEQKYKDLEEKYRIFGLQENEARIQMKNDLNKAYQKQITYINHSVKDYIDLTRPIDIYLKNKRDTMNPEDFLSMTRIYSYGLYHLASIMSSEIKEHQHTKNLKTIDFFDSFKAPYPVGFHKNIINFIDISYIFSTKLCKFCTENTLDTSKLKKDSFKLKLKESTHMDHIAFEFIFNALKYMPATETPFIKIYSLDDNSGIIIENPVEEDFSVKSMIAQIANNEGLGLSLIQAILKNDNYTMTFKKVKSNNILQIIIRKEIV